jgi:hypothetical protein
MLAAIIDPARKGTRGMSMIRTMATYGLISGLVVAGAITATVVMGGETGHQANLWLGYLIMLVALSSILVGVKQYRDQALGGAISFWKALLLGLGIALFAGIAYVIVWETYLALTHYTFMDHYIASTLEAKRAAGVTGAEYAKAVAEMATMKAQYANPLYRMPMTFIEIFPVGLVIALVSAALLRNPKILPARSRPVAA